MNTLPPAIGQTMRYPRFLTEPEAAPLERWKALLASDAKIIARTVSREVHAALCASNADELEAPLFVDSFEMLSGRVYALVESVSRSVPGVRRRLVDGAMLSSDRRAIFCGIVATRCRKELGQRVPDDAGVRRVMSYVEQRTEETYLESVTFVARLLAESAVIDIDDLCRIHLRELAARLRALFDLEPSMRAALLALPLDSETRAMLHR